MSEITRRLSAYITETGTDLKKMSEKTGISYTCLYDSLRHTDRDRPLRDYELAAICNYLGKDVSDFLDGVIVINGRRCSVINILGEGREILASISADDIVEKSGITVECVFC